MKRHPIIRFILKPVSRRYHRSNPASQTYNHCDIQTSNNNPRNPPGYTARFKGFAKPTDALLIIAIYINNPIAIGIAHNYADAFQN